MDLTPQSSPTEDSIPLVKPTTPAAPQAAPAAARYRTRPYHVHAAFLPLVFLIGLGVGYLLWDRSAKPSAAQPYPAAAANQQVKRYNIPVSNSDPSLGPKDAPVTVVMFSDYQCPYCRKWYSDTFKPLMSAYQGQVRFVYKDFPLSSIHEEASPAALAARCAGEQGKYWEYQDLLFTGPEGLSAAAYTKYAQSLALDDAKFNECVASKRYQKTIEDDYQTAAGIGIQSTPTFFINGVPLIGAQPIDAFKQLIDQELAGKVN
jgi:protein-disulfide isomerase